MNENLTVRAFQKALSEGKLLGSWCGSCGEVFLPPRPLCPSCGSRSMEAREFSGSGTLTALTEIHVPLTSLKDRCPYMVGIVKLDEGPSICGQVEGEDGLDLGARVRPTFIRKDDRIILGWKPA